MRSRIPRPGLGVAALLLLLPACGQDRATPATPAPPEVTTPPPPTPEAPAPAPIPPEVGAWLDANVHPFAGSHLSLPHDDLEFLRDLVGDARIVALGENTHGTRDFFEMKARILRFLVEEMDFNTFAIEATWPEAHRLDRYVRTGEGNPAILLPGLYFWTWNTESVLEMIEWMRDHNEAGGDLGFHGVDMQRPGMALHLVREYIRFVDPASLPLITDRLDCLTRFANEPSGWGSGPFYRDQTDAYKTQCDASLEEARAHLVENRERYAAAGGEDRFTLILRSLRVAYQYHLRYSGGQSRDESMAENTVWLSERIGPEGRMVLWAHNYHVATKPGLQGYYQRQTFGDDMVVIGFSHATGRFTAVDFSIDTPAPGRSNRLDEFDLDPPKENSFEAHFATASAPRFVLDLRRPLNEPGSAWLSEPRPGRHIGCCYRADDPLLFWNDEALLPQWFDVIIHFESTLPTVVFDTLPPPYW